MKNRKQGNLLAVQVSVKSLQMMPDVYEE